LSTRAAKQAVFESQVRKCHAEGLLMVVIAERLNCPIGKVQRALKRLGLEPNRLGAVFRMWGAIR
jgi:hypothetical protein